MIIWITREKVDGHGSATLQEKRPLRNTHSCLQFLQGNQVLCCFLGRMRVRGCKLRGGRFRLMLLMIRTSKRG